MLRYIDDAGLWKKVTRFEASLKTTAGRRIMDAMIYEGKILCRYEFKTWQEFYNSTFLKQFYKDYMFSPETLNNLRWVFDKRAEFVKIFANKSKLIEYVINIINSTNDVFTSRQKEEIISILTDIIKF